MSVTMDKLAFEVESQTSHKILQQCAVNLKSKISFKDDFIQSY